MSDVSKTQPPDAAPAQAAPDGEEAADRRGVPEGKATPPPPPPRPPGPADDMHDSDEDLARWPLLAGNLRLCGEVIEPRFRASDGAAIRHERIHRGLTNMAAGFGTAAVLFAILQLAFPEAFGHAWLKGAEPAAAAAAFVAVVLGLVSSRQANWLLERHKSEFYRLLKFRFLIDPATWSGDEAVRDARVATLRRELAEVSGLTAGAVRRRSEEDRVPPMLGLAGQAVPPEGVVAELAEYYAARRLEFQRRFFEDRARRNVRLDRFTRLVAPAFFFGSVAAALAHFAHDIVLPHHLHFSATSKWFIVLAAALPVVGAGIRTLRMAHEFARNTSRYRAKSFALGRVGDMLRREPGSGAKFRHMWYCEEVLEFEHMEWSRLMIEAEWFA